MRKRLTLALAAILAAPLAARAETAESPQELTPVVMQFDWIFNAQFAGFYQAIEQGYYEEVGIELELRGGQTTPDTVKSTLEEPQISFGSAESNVLLGDAAEGADLKIIGTMFQASPMGWMYVKGGDISEFTDLADKRVGVHADGWRVIRLALKHAGADISELETYDCGYDPSIVIDGEAEAMQCYYIDEYVRLEQLIGEKAGVFLAKDYGYKAYSQVMFTASETVESHPEVVEAFLDATKRGWQYAFENPQETVDLIVNDYLPEVDPEYQLRSLEKIEELMVPEPGALFRPLQEAVLDAGMQRLLDYDLIEKSIPAADILAQDFLPKSE